MSSDFPSTDEMVANLMDQMDGGPVDDDNEGAVTMEVQNDLAIPDVMVSSEREPSETMKPVDYDGTKPNVDPDEPQEEPETRTSVLEKELATVREESAGRLNEIVEMRKAQSEFNKNLDQMRQLMLEKERAAEEEERKSKELELYGQETLDDPAIRLIRDEQQKTREMIARQEQMEHQRQEHNRRLAHEAKLRADEQAIVDRVEESYNAFIEDHQDFNDAYNHGRDVRMNMLRSRGFDDQQATQLLALEEFQLATEAIRKGESPAKRAYDLAVSLGWQGSLTTEPKAASTPYEGVHESLDKMREGLRADRAANASAGRSNPGRMTREQFFKTVPRAERAQILSDPVKFRQLGKYGYVDI